MTEAEFIERWHSEREMYRALGRLVVDTVVGSLAGIAPHCLKLPMEPRLKEDDSMLAKAFQRKKYADPYGQVEDKVGVRAVVLFSAEIRTIAEIVEHCGLWTCSRDRDFEEERRQRPFEFSYQSVHYVIKAGASCSFGGTAIAEGTPCELQIRTILQHAYSELTHDTIYKPSVQADPDVHRAAAKSMALIEATDDYFMAVRTKLAEAAAPSNAWAAALSRAFADAVGRHGEKTPLNDLLIDHYRRVLPLAEPADVERLLEEKSYIGRCVRERYATMVLFRQPAILLIYLAVLQARFAAASDSPLGDDELELIYSDLGLSLPS